MEARGTLKPSPRYRDAQGGMVRGHFVFNAKMGRWPRPLDRYPASATETIAIGCWKDLAAIDMGRYTKIPAIVETS